MAKPVRTFSANVGQKSVETAGPDQIEYDLDQLFAMFDPAKTLPDGEAPGGLSKENVREGIATLNDSEQVEQDGAYSSGVSGFTPTTVKAALDALAGVRIVEMGSNANGEYVRWENGLQVCYIGPVDTVFTNPSNLAYSWAYPAAFASTPRVYATGYYQAFSTKFRGTAHLVYSRQAGTNKADIGFGSSAAWEDGDQSLGEQIMGYAIGRWK